MTERNERVETLVRAYVLEKFRDKPPGDDSNMSHLTRCPDAAVSAATYHGTYRWPISRPHGKTYAYWWGEFGSIALEALRKLARDHDLPMPRDS